MECPLNCKNSKLTLRDLNGLEAHTIIHQKELDEICKKKNYEFTIDITDSQINIKITYDKDSGLSLSIKYNDMDEPKWINLNIISNAILRLTTRVFLSNASTNHIESRIKSNDTLHIFAPHQSPSVQPNIHYHPKEVNPIPCDYGLHSGDLEMIMWCGLNIELLKTYDYVIISPECLHFKEITTMLKNLGVNVNYPYYYYFPKGASYSYIKE